MESEHNNKLKFRYITIKRGKSKFTYIFRKPTVTSTTIYNTSCHPYEHKKAVFTYKIDLKRIKLHRTTDTIEVI
jgi:hypothetical protein